MPPLEILDDPKLICMGKAMKNMISYQETPLIVAAVRPDYLLFPDSIGEMKRTHKYQYLQLTQGYTILPKIQPYTNSFATDVTIVVDENLWDFDTESIIKILLQLKGIKNIGFQEPIKIKKIIENEKLQNLFKELHFDKIYRNRFINNYGNDIKSIKKIIDFLGNFEQYKCFKPFKVQTIKTREINTFTRYDAQMELFEDLEIMDYAKQKQVRLNFTLNVNKYNEYWDYFTQFKIWSNNAMKKSYIEFMCRYSIEWSGKSVSEILNNKTEWFSYLTKELVYLLKNYYDIIEPWIYRRWGDEKMENKINIDYIKKEG